MAGYLATFISMLFQVLTMAIFARVLLSWFPMREDHPLKLLLMEITDPILVPLRRIVPRLGMLDITPIVAMFLLQILEGVLLNSLRGF